MIFNKKEEFIKRNLHHTMRLALAECIIVDYGERKENVTDLNSFPLVKWMDDTPE